MQKRDIQQYVLKILIESKRNRIPYLTRAQIAEKVKTFKPNEKNIERKTSQAIYLLSIKRKKWDQPKVIKFEKGWTVDRITKR